MSSITISALKLLDMQQNLSPLYCITYTNNYPVIWECNLGMYENGTWSLVLSGSTINKKLLGYGAEFPVGLGIETPVRADVPTSLPTGVHPRLRGALNSAYNTLDDILDSRLSEECRTRKRRLQDLIRRYRVHRRHPHFKNYS